MLSLVTPETEALKHARERMSELHEFLYDDASQFAKEAARRNEIRLLPTEELRQDALEIALTGFLHGEVTAIADRRADDELISLTPDELIGTPVWDGTLRMMGDRLKTMAPVSVAMCYVYDLTDEEDSTGEAILAAWGVASGFQRGRQHVANEVLPLSASEIMGLAATVERLNATVERASDEAVGYYQDELSVIHGGEESGVTAFRHEVKGATEEYANNAILSPVYADHLRCHQSVVVGRIRTFAYHFATGMRDAMLDAICSDFLLEAMFREDRMYQEMLGEEPLPIAVRRVNEEVCDIPLNEGMIPLAVSCACLLSDSYGEMGAGPIDFTLNSGEFTSGIPTCEPVDVTQRIAIASVAYAAGVRRALQLDMRASDRTIEFLDSLGIDKSGYEWPESWDVEGGDGLPAWVSLRMTDDDFSGVTPTQVHVDLPDDDDTVSVIEDEQGWDEEAEWEIVTGDDGETVPLDESPIMPRSPDGIGFRLI